MSLLSTIQDGINNAISVFSGGVPPSALKSEEQAVGGAINTIGEAPADFTRGLTRVGNAISSVGDFLSFISWLFHPLNWLRLAEFIWGTFIGAIGLYMLARRGGGASSRIVRRAISATPAGRAARVAQGRRMGRYEGQREAARMEARQTETRQQRESSAVERERINRRARQTARES